MAHKKRANAKMHGKWALPGGRNMQAGKAGRNIADSRPSGRRIRVGRSRSKMIRRGERHERQGLDAGGALAAWKAREPPNEMQAGCGVLLWINYMQST